jgi:hypothetical protein
MTLLGSNDTEILYKLFGVPDSHQFAFGRWAELVDALESV